MRNKVKPSEKVIYSGFRAMGRGTFPPSYWVNITKQLASSIPGTSPGGIWILGRIVFSPKGTCILSFPHNQTYPNVHFEKRDRNEAYLKAFDNKGIKVWLQVEPGFADVDLLIDLVLERYGHHPSILGFGIDLEWRWRRQETDKTAPVTDAEAKQWLNKIKSHNPNYKLFLKHWLTRVMPPTARQDIIFIDDSQRFKGLDSMIKEFRLWGEHFSQTDVGYQVGYKSDRRWWSELEDPPREIGLALIQKIPNCRFIYWTDETIHELFQSF